MSLEKDNEQFATEGRYYQENECIDENEEEMCITEPRVDKRHSENSNNSSGNYNKNSNNTGSSISCATEGPKCDRMYHRTNSSNLLQDELLMQEVRKYPCLYDRCHDDYKKPEKMLEAWKRVCEICDWIESRKYFLRIKTNSS